MRMRRWRYELRALGLGPLALPLVVVGVFVGVTLLIAFDVTHSSYTQEHIDRDVGLGLLALLELGLPLVAGFAAAWTVSSERARELHLTLRRSYVRVMACRLTLLLLWMAGICAAASWLISALGYWVAPQPAPQSALAWAAPVLWFAGAGALLALALESWVVSTAVLGALWFGELLLRSPVFLPNYALREVYLFLTLASVPGGEAPNADYWLSNRLTLAGMGILFLLLSLALLRRSEALVRREA
jgi:hypothetical protein